MPFTEMYKTEESGFAGSQGKGRVFIIFIFIF